MPSGYASEPPTPLALRLRRLRQTVKLTQAQLSAVTGIPTCHISNYETGLHVPTLDILRRYGAYFKLTLSELLEGIP